VLDAVLRLDTHVLLADDPVKPVDNMSMAWGLKVRMPYLDQDLVALVAACPSQLKTAQGGKGILKDIARAVLPADLVDRPAERAPHPDRIQQAVATRTARALAAGPRHRAVRAVQWKDCRGSQRNLHL
jgi:asparagine synthase (glutamine-hydrolysing)